MTGAVSDTGTLSSPPTAVPEKKAKKEKTSKTKKPVESKSATDSSFEEFDQKWSDHFNRFHGFLTGSSRPFHLLWKSPLLTLHQLIHVFQRTLSPFSQPTSSGCTGMDFSASMHQSASQPESDTRLSSGCTGKDSSVLKHQLTSQLRSDRHRPRSSSPKRTGNDSSATKHQSTSQLQSDWNRPRSSEHNDTDSSITRHQSTSKLHVTKSQTDQPKSSVRTDTGSPALHRQRQDSISSLSSEADSDFSDRPPVDLYAEEGELSEDLDLNATEPDQALTEEQTYRETMRGIRSYIGWSNIPDMDSATTGSDDNPSGPKVTVPGKISVQMPREDWLCKKLNKLNITLVEGYPSRSSEASGQFLRPAKSQSKWYGLYSNHKADPSAVSICNTNACKLNSCYSRVSRQSGLTSTSLTSWRISQETLQRWEKFAREATVICNQAASFNRCLFKVQQSMQDQLKTVCRVPPKCLLLWTNCSIWWTLIQASPRLQQRLWSISPSLSSYTWGIWLLYAGTLALPTWRVTIPLGRLRKRLHSLRARDIYLLRVARDTIGNSKSNLPAIPYGQPRASSPINDNYCINKLQEGLLAESQAATPRQTINTQLNSHVNFPVVKIVHTAPGLSQRKEVSPGATGCCQKEYQLKYVKGVSRVTQLSKCCLKSACRGETYFWQTWLDLGASPKVTPSPSRPGPTWQDLQTS